MLSLIDDFASGPPPKKSRCGGPEGGSSVKKSRGGDAQVKSVKEEPKKQTRSELYIMIRYTYYYSMKGLDMARFKMKFGIFFH